MITSRIQFGVFRIFWHGGIVLVTFKLIPFGSTGVGSWLSSFKLMETVLSSIGIAVASLVRKIVLWPCFVFLITFESINLEKRIYRHSKPHFWRYHGKWNRGLKIFLNLEF